MGFNSGFKGLIVSSSLSLTAGLSDVQLVNQSFRQEVIQFFKR